MIVTATPYRVSFFGGGTDYPVWFKKHGGAVLSTTINRYCYIQCRYLPPFFEHKHRIVWSHIETPSTVEEIEHPVVRAALLHTGIHRGIEIHHMGDMPARAGIGSSSSFAAGVLNALHTINGKMISKQNLAKEAIYLEQDLLKENVGIQDQISAVYGGLNMIEFDQRGEFSVRPVPLTNSRRIDFFDHLVLMFTGVSRYASVVATHTINSIPNKTDVLHQMRALVDEGAQILVNSATPIEKFGELLHKSWMLKRSIDPNISGPEIDGLYQRARKAGAIGGKLLGAGGGGFFLFFLKPEDREKLKAEFNDYLFVPLQGEDRGSHVKFYTDDEYELGISASDKVRLGQAG